MHWLTTEMLLRYTLNSQKLIDPEFVATGARYAERASVGNNSKQYP